MNDEDKLRGVLIGVFLFILLLLLIFHYPNLSPEEKQQFWSDVAESIDDISDDGD